MYRLIRYAQPLAANVANYRSRWSGLEQELSSLFGSAGSEYTRSIPVSVNEDKDNLQITAELPGVQRADVTVEIVDEVLSVKATRKVAGVEGEQTISFARELDLPYPVQADKVAAELKDGVLRLTLPKVEAVKPRKIEIS
ncbi:MAG TPA: Hsp20/alpha crystallin family protein [Lacunisphaera sp.]|jgi:HSP20 family protein